MRRAIREASSMIRLAWLPLVPLAACVQPSAERSESVLYVVAEDDCGAEDAQPHLLSGGPYTYPAADVPLAVVPEDDPLRTVAYGERVELGYDGLHPGAAYRARFELLSDGPRAQRIEADGVVLEGRVELTRAAPLTLELDLPAEVTADGEVRLALVRMEGPNAVVSRVTVLSDDPARLSALPLPPRAPLVTEAEREALAAEVRALRPRLTPRPVEVQGVEQAVLCLDEGWRFHPAPGAGFGPDAGPDEGWSPIEVPGEWTLQGFHVEPDTFAGYALDLRVPADFAGKRVKLRFDSVYSECTVWMNGREAGGHLGGFTPFELDVTDLVRCGETNGLRVAVKSESLADQLATASQYAAHPLGGLLRKVQLFAVPEVHVASLRCSTELGEDDSFATLVVEMDLVNEGALETSNLRATLSGVQSRVLPQGELPYCFDAQMELALPRVGGRTTHEERVRIYNQCLWDPEHPNLFDVSLVLRREGQSANSELPDYGVTVRERIGLRQVEVRGNELLVNGRPVRLRGVNRHETEPIHGRALQGGPIGWIYAYADAVCFKEANCNFIRTSHYPPAEEFLAACDELGLMVELEAPLCWIGHGANPIWQEWDYRDPRFYEPILQAELETVESSFDHPSVVLRSLANESAWSDTFAQVAKRVAVDDPTRPLTFHDQCWGDYNNHGSGALPVANIHYPGPNGPARVAAEGRPVTFGEYCHLNTYNREEIAADPGVRDAYGRALSSMWERMVATPGCLGGSIWSGIDDVFHLPDGTLVGYGEWGSIDGWRRKKPEYWHIQQVFAPVHFPMVELEVPAPGAPLVVPVANRFDFTDLSELQIEAEPGGPVEITLAPRSSGELMIPPPDGAWSGGETVTLRVRRPGTPLSIDAELSVGPRVPAVVPFANEVDEAVTLTCEEREDVVVVSGAGFTWEIQRDTGRIARAAIGDTEVLVGGPDLMLLPLRGGPCTTYFSADIVPFTPVLERRSGRVEAVETSPKGASVRVRESYVGAEGSYTLAFDASGGLTIDYRYEVTEAVDPRQTGVVVTLAPGFETLSWARDVERPIRDPDFLGRPEGTAIARRPEGRRVEPGQWPHWPWIQDENELGSNDFRATRANVRWARLVASGLSGLGVVSDGTQAVRAWLDGPQVHLLVAGFDTGGADMFLSSHYAAERRPLVPGDVVADTIRLRLLR